MNETIRSSREKATKAIQEYRDELLKEFLFKGLKLSKEFESLIENGVDECRHIYLEDVDVDRSIYYYNLDRESVAELKYVLDSMDKTNAIQNFDGFIKKEPWSSIMFEYENFLDMTELSTEYICAENLLLLLIDEQM